MRGAEATGYGEVAYGAAKARAEHPSSRFATRPTSQPFSSPAQMAVHDSQIWNIRTLRLEQGTTDLVMMVLIGRSGIGVALFQNGCLVRSVTPPTIPSCPCAPCRAHDI